MFTRREITLTAHMPPQVVYWQNSKAREKFELFDRGDTSAIPARIFPISLFHNSRRILVDRNSLLCSLLTQFKVLWKLKTIFVEWMKLRHENSCIIAWSLKLCFSVNYRDLFSKHYKSISMFHGEWWNICVVCRCMNRIIYAAKNKTAFFKIERGWLFKLARQKAHCSRKVIYAPAMKTFSLAYWWNY